MIAPWMLKVIGPLSSAVSAGRRKLADWYEADITPDREQLAIYMLLSLNSIDPQIKGKPMLDDEIRMSLASGLAGMLINIMAAELGDE
jgi:hypothetical protein